MRKSLAGPKAMDFSPWLGHTKGTDRRSNSQELMMLMKTAIARHRARPQNPQPWRTAAAMFAWILATALLWTPEQASAAPPGCKPPELVISREHPLLILYGPGTAELTVKCWRNLQPDIKPYSVVTMDPTALDLQQRLDGWRRMLRIVQAENIPIALQICGDSAEWTTPVPAVESLLQELPCIKILQVVEVRCAYYSRFGGDLEMAIPPNLRYLAEILKLCGKYGKHLSLQIQGDMVHLGTDALAGPLRDVFRVYHEYFLPQNECIGPQYYASQTAAWGLWLAGYCDHWGMEPQWWWWTRGESYFIRPGLFGVEAEFKEDDSILDAQARLYRAFIIEGALMGATVFSIEPPQDVWKGESTDPRHFDRVIYPTLRQLIEQKLIPSKEDVLARAKVAYQLPESKTLHEFDNTIQDIDLELGHGYLERAAYGALHPHLMKELIPDTAGRYFFIPLLPVGTPKTTLQHFEKIIHPGECSSVEGYRSLLNRYYPPTENSGAPNENNRAFVLRSGRAVAVMQSRENLYEQQPFALTVPRWVTGLSARKQDADSQLSWDPDPQSKLFRIWTRIPRSTVYPQWKLVTNTTQNSCTLPRSMTGTFAVTAQTSATAILKGTVNYSDYLLFPADESPIMEQVVITEKTAPAEKISWTRESLPVAQEIWRIFDGVQPGRKGDAEIILGQFQKFIAAFEAKDLDALMSFYAPEYRDSNGYSTEYVRRAWLWWYQRTVNPYVVAQLRRWDTSKAADGIIQFTAWNRFRGIIVWDEPFGYHGRVRIPRHEGERVTWTWKKNSDGDWKLIRTEPALPNFGEMLWIGRGHDVKHTMEEFADSPRSRGVPLTNSINRTPPH